MRFKLSKTGLSLALYLRSTQSLLAGIEAVVKLVGEGPEIVPLVMLWMKPCCKRIETIDKLSIVDGIGTERILARAAF